MSDAGAVAPEQTYKPDLDEKKRLFDEARELMTDSRKLGELSRDYYDGEQLTRAQRQVLRKRKQPDIVINRIRPAINGIMGVVEQGKSDPRAYMRNPPKPQQQPAQMPGVPPAQALQQEPTLDAGDVASMTLRYIADTIHFHPMKMDSLESGLIEGCGAAIFEVDGNREVTGSTIRWEEFFYDPRSRKPDFSDARYLGVAKWMYADDVKAIYPQEVGDGFDSFISTGTTSTLSGFDESWDDRPTNKAQSWVDSKQRRLMVVEMYHREAGSWYKCVFYAGGMLEAVPSPYLDDKGKPVCPIEAWSAFVDRNNNRYGMIKDMMGPQDEINSRRSKAIHEINTRQLQRVDLNAPPVDTDVARAEAARPDGIIPTGYQVVPRNDVVANNIEMLAEAKSEIERMGPNPAILGRQGADASGRSVQLRQQAGIIELSRVLGRFQDWEHRCYMQMWSRARQFYDGPKFIRVTDDEGAAQYIQINEPTGQMDQNGQPVMNHHIAQMDVDIVVDSVPDTATLEQEIYSDVLELSKAYIGTPQQVPISILLRLSPVPKKRELIKEMEAIQQQQAQAAQPVQQLDMAQKSANVEKTHSEVEKNLAQAKKDEVSTVRDAMQGHVEALNPHAMLPPPPGDTGANAGPTPG